MRPEIIATPAATMISALRESMSKPPVRDYLKIQTQLPLKLPMDRALGLRTREKAKIRIIRVQIEEARSRCQQLRLRMIEHVLCIHTDLHSPGLFNLDRFAHAQVEAPASRSFDRPLC